MKTILLSKRLNLSLIECLDPAANLQKIKRAEEHIELHLEYVVSQIQTVDSGQIRCSGFFTDML